MKRRKHRDWNFILTIVFIVLISIIPLKWQYILYILIFSLTFVYLIYDISLILLIKRLYFLLPLLFLLIFSRSIDRSIFILSKSISCLMILVLYTLTNSIYKTIHELRHLGLPKIVTSILFFMYRYSFSLMRDLDKYKMSFKLRSFDQKIPWRNKVKNIGNIIGTLLIKSIDNSERIYYAMVLRGFEGEIKSIDE